MTTYTEAELFAAVQAGYHAPDDLPLATRSWLEGYRGGRSTPPPVIPPQWRVVMRGMVEYAECNDPGNPYLDQAKALLSAGKGE